MMIHYIPPNGQWYNLTMSVSVKHPVSHYLTLKVQRSTSPLQCLYPQPKRYC